MFKGDPRKVSIYLPGVDKATETTIGKLRRHWRRQSEVWKENFFYNLLNNGSIDLGTARYVLQDHPANSDKKTN